MKRFSLSFLMISLLSLPAFRQSGGTNAAIDLEKVAVMKVFDEYLKAMQADQAERDGVRVRLLTEDYFYTGMDGLPAGKDSVMQREKRNGLRINSLKMTDIKILLYENTAILTMRMTGAGVDRGRPWGGDGKESGQMTVMVKQKGKWFIAADVVGRGIEK